MYSSRTNNNNVKERNHLHERNMLNAGFSSWSLGINLNGTEALATEN